MSEEKELDVLLFKARMEMPYFSRILFALKDVKTTDIPTFAVDNRMRLFYNPKMFESGITLDQLVGCMYHEINHLIRDHPKRRGNRDEVVITTEGQTYSLWNIAGDLEINQDAKIDNKRLPAFAIYPDTWKPPMELGHTAEYYYDLLLKNTPSISISIPSKSEGAPSAGQCGKCSGGHGKDEKEDQVSSQEEGVDGFGEKSVEFFAKATAQDIEAYNNKNPGNIPGSLLRWAKEKLKSKIDWKKHLRNKLTNSIELVTRNMYDYSWGVRNRRSSAFPNIVLPGFSAPKPSIGIIIDTSGSIDDNMVGQAIAEVTAVLKNCQSNIIVASVDHAVHNIGKIRTASELKLVGGGGTDMRLGYEAMANFKPKPEIVILISDLYTPFPEDPIKGTKNIIVCTCKYHGQPYPKWAQLIETVFE